MDQTPEAEN